MLTRWTDPSALTELDRRTAEWWVDRRTATGDTLAAWGARLADTPVKVGFTALAVTLMLWRWRRWHDGLMVALPLLFEATAFIVTTFLVGRPRPDVPRLQDSPVDSSFPSGHVAAATVYAAVAVVVFWHVRATWARVLAVTVAASAPVVVGLARMYQGMHYLSDVVAGVVLGAVSVVICRRVLGAPPGDGADVVHERERPTEVSVAAGAGSSTASAVDPSAPRTQPLSINPPMKGPNMTNDAAVIADLVQTLEDGREGFAKAADKLDGAEHAPFVSLFRELSAQRDRFSAELRNLDAADAGDADGTLAGSLHRGWIALKDALTGSSTEAVLNAVTTGEDHAVSEYDKALETDLSATIRTIVERQRAEIVEARNRMESLASAVS